MTYIVADRVKETTTVTGTGPATLAGAASGYRSFASQLSIGDTCAYVIVNSNGSEWETGIGTYSAVNTLTRTTIHASTNANAAVVFTAGTKDVFMGPTADSLVDYNPVTGAISNATWNGSTISTSKGGTGLTTLGTANQALSVNSAGTALEYHTVVGSVASADGSVTVSQTGQAVDLSVAVAAATTNVIVQVRNNTGATLTKGIVVYINNAIGQIPTVAKALATSDATSAQTLGMISADLANNSNGYVTIIGLISNINTSAYVDGDQLYLSGTTAGTFTKVKPYAPTHLVYVGIVEHAHVTQGKIFVKVQNGYEMDELHNVDAYNPSNGDLLIYNTSTNLWTHSPQSNLTVATSQITGTLPVANGGTGVTTSTGTDSVVLSNTPTLVTPQTNAINAVPVVSGAGNNLTFTAGSGVGTGAGGSLILQAGAQATSGGDGKIIVKGLSGSTANLQEWQDGSGNIRGLLTTIDSATAPRFSLQRSDNSEGFFVTTINSGNRGVWLSGNMGLFVGASVNNPDGGSLITNSVIAVRGDIGEVGFGAGTNPTSRDTVLKRDAAGTLAQRNGTNAQAFRVYNTYTDASNYERLNINWATNQCNIFTEAAGTGTARLLQVGSSIGGLNLVGNPIYLSASAQFQSGGLVLKWYNGSTIGVGPSFSDIYFSNPNNLVSVRNGTTGQSFAVYNTFTDTSNYERLGITWASNVCTIGVAQAGTGVPRVLNVNANNINAPTLPTAATVTAATGNGTTVTYTAANTFSVGQVVSITGLTTTTGSSLNLSNQTITTASATQFTITNATVGTAAATQAGTATIQSAGNSVTITAGNGSGVGAGGNIILQPGAQGSSGGDGVVHVKSINGTKTSKIYTSSTGNGQLNFLSDIGSVPVQIDTNAGTWNVTRSGQLTVGGNGELVLSGGTNRSISVMGLSGGAGCGWDANNGNPWAFAVNVNAGKNFAYYASVVNVTGTFRDIWGGRLLSLQNNSVDKFNVYNDGSALVSGSLSFPSSTTAFSANTNDLALTASAFQRINCTSAASLTGIAPPSGGTHVDGRMIRVYNVGTANLTLAHNSASSTTANKMFSSTGADIILAKNDYAELIYDATDNGSGAAGWRVS